MNKNELIANQALKIAQLEEEIASLKDSERRRKDWLWKAKQDAGAPQNESFDTVWARALAALKSTQVKA